VQPVFPSNFVIQLDEPPPQGVFMTVTGNPGPPLQIAQGVVVAYEDLNGNGKLDLVQDDAGAFVDKIIGVNMPGMSLVYLQGTLPPNAFVDPSGKAPSLGYNLLSELPCAGDGGGAGDIDMCIVMHWFDVSSPYDLEVSNDPEINQVMCIDFGSRGSGGTETGTGWSVDTQGTPPGGYPAPGANGLTCLGTTRYKYSQCQVVHNGLCEEMPSCAALFVSLGNAPAPAGWPCP
jgi:hypothetical protein